VDKEIKEQVDALLSEDDSSSDYDIHGLCGIKAVATDDVWEYVETAKGVLDKLSDDLSPIGIKNFAMAMIHLINSGYYGKSNKR